MYSTTDARAEITAYMRQMQPLIDLWSQIDRQASSELTAMPMRLMMGAHIEHLQSLYRGALHLPVPPRCRRAHAAFLAAIGAAIDAYLATSEVRSDDAAHTSLLGAMHAFHTWSAEVARIAPQTVSQ